MNPALLATFIVALASTGATAWAAEPRPIEATRELTQAPLARPISAARGIEVVTEQDSTSVAFRYGWTYSNTRAVGEAGSVGIFKTFSLGLSAPVAGDGDTEVFGLDALASGVALEAKFTHSSITRAPQRDGRAMLALCDAVRAEKPTETAARPCSTALISDFSKDDLPAFQALIWGPRPTATIWGFSARVGQNTFDYLDTATLAERSVEKSGWSIEGFWAYRRLNSPSIVTLGFEHQDAYESAASAIMCPAGAGILTCVEGAAGAPGKVRKDIVSVEYRRSFNDFSVSTALQYDANNDVWAAEVPIYLARNADGDFTGGLKLGWRSDTGDVTAGVFIGTAFSLGVPSN